jgi:hypothetical protein
MPKNLWRILNVVDPERLFFMKFEEVLSKPERTINKLCDFLEVGYSNEFFHVPYIGSSYSNANSDKRGIRGLQAFSKDHSSRVISNAVSIVSKAEMKKLGYSSRVFLDSSLLTLVLYIAFIPVQLILIVALNINRTENFFLSLKNRVRV